MIKDIALPSIFNLVGRVFSGDMLTGEDVQKELHALATRVDENYDDLMKEFCWVFDRKCKDFED